MACPEAAVQFLKFNCSQKDGAENLQFDTLALHGIYGFSADDGTATCYLDVVDELQNRYGTLHGGCIATLVDVVGSAALLTKIEKSGVSLNISVNYLRPGKGGSTVKIVGEVVKIGRTVCSIEVAITEKDSGRLIAKGTHVKHILEAEPPFPRLDSVAEELTHRRNAVRNKTQKSRL
ncbi:hypothetical protein ACKKBG_A28220 [Auxenochlorella protothecoides x Auxenochlorella symbiontica]